MDQQKAVSAINDFSRLSTCICMGLAMAWSKMFSATHQQGLGLQSLRTDHGLAKIILSAIQQSELGLSTFGIHPCLAQSINVYSPMVWFLSCYGLTMVGKMHCLQSHSLRFLQSLGLDTAVFSLNVARATQNVTKAINWQLSSLGISCSWGQLWCGKKQSAIPRSDYKG